MAGIKYDKIYKDLKSKIESGEYALQDLIPSETVLCKQFECSRNTIRRAINSLADKGYVQSIHGKGVRVIYQPLSRSTYSFQSIESFKETAVREEKNVTTKILLFTELVVDEKISNRTNFPMGIDIYYIQRLRYFDGHPFILDHNYFRKDIVKFLSEEIAEKSIYEHIENTMDVQIATTKRSITVERITELDEKYLELNDANCVAVVSNHTYNNEGIIFEYTQSRHCPDNFVFRDNARRLKDPIEGAVGKYN